MIYKINESKSERELTIGIINELNYFFDSNINLNDLGIFFVSSRKMIDFLAGKKTQDWVTALTNNNNRILILDRENFEKESCHKYNEKYYNSLLKHEIVHIFTFSLYKLIFSDWLIEGIAIYLSGQNKYREQPKKFERFISYWEGSGGGLYEESGFAIQVLIEKYGKKKFLKLLGKLKENHSQEYFNKKFNEVYGFIPNYEKFNELILY